MINLTLDIPSVVVGSVGTVVIYVVLDYVGIKLKKVKFGKKK